jgi:pimeloyl-ACP methyl ester carboxylesterase
MTIVLAYAAVIVFFVVLIGLGLALFAANTTHRVEAGLPPQGQFIEVEGARIHYVEKGSGPPILMLHGLGGQTRHFTHSMLARLSTDFRVVIVDRPGSGYSTRRGGASARLSVQAASVAGVIHALGLTRLLVVGHSLGGALALAVALDHPEFVGGLALIAPLTQVETAPPGVFTRLAIASSLLRRIVAWTVATPLAIRGSRVLLAAIFAPEPVPRDFATAGGGLLSLRPRSFYETSSDLVAVNNDLPGMVERYPTLRVPVGILFGRGDHILDPAVHGERTAAAIPGATLELLDGGHMLPITQADRCVEFVREVAGRVG